MEILYLRQALKDVNKIKNKKLKSKLFDVVNNLKLAENLSEIKNVKAMSGHPEAYRISVLFPDSKNLVSCFKKVLSLL